MPTAATAAVVVSAADARIAAVVLQAGLRGFRGRWTCRMRRREKDMALLVQRHYRGLLGRKLATERRWQKLSVVKSMAALTRMQERSLVTEQANGWTEMVDPLTNSLWFLPSGKFSLEIGRGDDDDELVV